MSLECIGLSKNITSRIFRIRGNITLATVCRWAALTCPCLATGSGERKSSKASSFLFAPASQLAAREAEEWHLQLICRELLQLGGPEA